MESKGRVAVVTGGASGLGKATALALAESGARLAILDLNQELAEATAKAIGGGAAAFKVNVASSESAEHAVEAVLEKFGAIHINVNCAGIGAAARTVGRNGALPLEQFQFVIQVNLVGTFNTLRLCARAMQANEPDETDGERGVIVNAASVAAFDGQIGQAAYSASKGGVVGMTLPIARDLARNGIRVCTIAPGVFETPMMIGTPDKVREPLIASVQFPNRLGDAREFAGLVEEIVRNRYLNGETIRLDGGIRMGPR
ncbi:MAG: SDR family NAD(P)-dependent oxidoreductase [Pseudomonadales bacterium]|nr:SDR family NAD(P)-dependent oxidoreductase [Pseudomonadales bacterium]